MATVDVSIPCYRYGRFLETCVQSILTQSMSDVRILIIDDASPDGSGNIARRLAASDPRIEAWVHSENRGHIATFNEGIAWAAAPYFLNLSADDYLAPGALARAVAVMDANPDVVMTYGTGATLLEGQPPPLLDDAPEDAKWRIRPGRDFVEEHCRTTRNLVLTPTVVVRTGTQKEIGGYLAALPHACDMEMWMRFAAHGRIAETPRTQAVYRVHGANMSSAYNEAVISDYAQRAGAFDTHFATHGRLLEGADKLYALARSRLAAAAFWTGIAQFCRGRRSIGAEVLRFGLKLNPKMRFAPPLGHLIRRAYLLLV